MVQKKYMNQITEIETCSLADTATILALYEDAMQLQIQKNRVVWPRFNKAFIEKEIRELRQWKLLTYDQIACNWAVTFDDKEIWGDREHRNAVYIHRIVTRPSFRGNRCIDVIVAWAKNYAVAMGKQYVRLDTLGNNTRLIEHYTSAGFTFLGITTLTDTTNLPAHYHREPRCCRFEMEIQ